MGPRIVMLYKAALFLAKSLPSSLIFGGLDRREKERRGSERPATSTAYDLYYELVLGR